MSAPQLPQLAQLLPCLLVILLLCSTPPLRAAAAENGNARQDLRLLRAQAEEFLLAQSSNLPGKASVVVSDPDPRLQLASCAAPQFNIAPGARAYGKTTLIARCSAPVAWSVYLKATVKVVTAYVSSAVPLAQGQRPGESDLVMKEADLATLPAGVLTDLAQAKQRTVLMPVAAGLPLTQSMLKREPVVQPGQIVRLVAQGAGFSISAEARALTGGAEGDLVRARTASGQVVAGTAQADGVLNLHY